MRWSSWHSAQALAIVALVAAATAIGLIFWLLAAPAPTFVLNTAFMQVLTPKVRAGHAVLLLVDYCKRSADVASVGSVLARRGTVFPLGMWSSDLPLGCHKVAVGIHIPAHVPPQTYVLYLTREYRPTIFTTQGYSIASDPFEILPFDGSTPPPLPIPTQYDDPNYDPPLGPTYTRPTARP